ncbi:FtsX-like permease family protein [Fictibacillus barbaricus]|uniref:ABC transporter permease n=1 Tax=Fictibacillus barbaricus TaxID=182136 RepID=A0ABS2ZBY5_9BACL|nr:FtsX-like permease family protein [Fictibacillus barbaricus]MBN3544174.1 ABC transporter permease [Fictibacillus barbaricus]GGB69504.1 ABC transporter permease [Fictibacillus barbaricus]
MNIIYKLTVRHLKENKRRTLVTIIGVIISVAMVTSVATLGVSFLDLMKRQTIENDGEWHIQYLDVNKDQIEAIEKDKETKRLIISNDRGYALLKNSKNENKPYLFIKEFNEHGFKNFPIELSKGRLPQSQNEVIISEEITSDADVDYVIGDKIKMDIGERFLVGNEQPLFQNEPLQKNEDKQTEILKVETTETYKVVGIIKRPTWEPTWSPGYTVISFMDEKMLDETDSVDASVVLNNVNDSLYQHAETFKNQYDIKKVLFNDNLLRYYGVTDNNRLRTTFFSLAGIILGIIITGSVSLIYNAFAISVSERSKHFGMLSSIGATKNQKRNSVFFEGAIIGAISIPVGIIAGIVGMTVTFWFINSFIEGALGVTEKLQVIVTPISILVASFISILTIFISTYLPARKASKVSAIDAIRQTQDVKLSGKIVKTSKLIRKLFGIEAEIGLKNLKRNKRRYQATIFSLVISIVLFLSVTFFISNLTKSMELSHERVNFDIRVSSNSENSDELKSIAKSKYVTESIVVKHLPLNTWIDESMIAEGLHEQIKIDKNILKDGKYPYLIYLYGLDEKSFQDYAKEVGADLEKLENPDNPTAIIIDKVSYEEPNTNRFIETKTINTEPGLMIDLYAMNYDTEEQVFLDKVKIGALTDRVPMGIDTSEIGGLDVIVTERTMDTLIKEQDEGDVSANLFMNSSDPMATQEEIEDLKQSDLYVHNVYQNRQKVRQLVMLMSVFTYGFIALITSISIANIINTISTSISLRKREFAMLKSVGMTPKGFNKMINYESIFYGMKALFYGLPISIAMMGLIYWSLRNTFEYGFALPWMGIIYAIIAIFILVSSTMLYSIRKVKNENIIDALKQENI